MKHGGDILSHRDRFEGKLIDFSSNINPLGYPEKLNGAIMDGIAEMAVYPDIKYRNLKKEISDYLGCRIDEVIVGNGAVEVINNFSILFKRVLVVTPCFIEYIERPLVIGREVVRLPLGADFCITIEEIIRMLKEGDLLILGNPNNPTGKRIDKDTLIEIHSLVIKNNAFLLLDEAFFEFCDYDYDSIELFRDSENVCVIRAATKFFALPGVRLGYAFTSRSMAIKYDTVAIPWCVNVFADIAGSVIFKDKDYITRSKRYMAEQRRRLLMQLKDIEGIKAIDTDCNFILIKLLRGNEDDIFDFLIKRGIIIRKASSFEGLDKSYIRIAVKTFENNQYLVNCLMEYK